MTILKNAFFVAVCLWIASPSYTEQQAEKPEAVVQEWFKRWNALDGSQEKTNTFLDLYQPNAIHQVGPSQRQIGPVFFEGREGIRKMVEDFAKVNTEIVFRIEKAGTTEKFAERIYIMQGPWGGPGVAVQFVGVYTVRETKKRFTYPGAAFFEILNGKIRYARFYAARDELAEISPTP